MASRILIINWNWGFETLPRFEGQTKPTTEWKQFLTRWQKDRLIHPVGESSNPEAVILPIQINLSRFMASDREIWLAKLLNEFRMSYPEEDILCLFHEKHGFQHELVKPPPAQDLGSNLEYYPFGGGNTEIYNPQGLLNSGKGNYFFSRKIKAAEWKEGKQEVKYVKSDHFEYVWRYYWQGAISKFKGMKKLFEEALIPGIPGEVAYKTGVRRSIRSFLAAYDGTVLGGGQEEISGGESMKHMYDFSTCTDLKNENYRKTYLKMDGRKFANMIEDMRVIVSPTYDWQDNDLHRHLKEMFQYQIKKWRE